AAGATAPRAPAPERRPTPGVVQSLGPGIAGPVAQFDSTGPAAAPAPRPPRFTIAVTTPQAVARVLDYISLAVLIGGGFFLARVWPDGTGERRARQLLWLALLASATATLGIFGFSGAG